MAKNFWFKFDWDDWLTDEALSACSLEAQGLWIRILCFMYRGEVAELTGTIDQLRRKLGVLPEELTRCLHELKTNGAADVRFGNGDVSIVSRRRKRDLKDNELNRLYVAKHRAKQACKDDVRIQSKSKSKSKSKEEEREAATPPAHPHPMVAVYREFYPDDQIALFLQDLIAGSVTDEAAWRRSLAFWKTNHYRAQSVGKLIERYNEDIKGKHNGTTNQSYQDRRAELAKQSYDRASEIRRRVERRDRELSGKALPDHRRQFQLVESNANGQRESSESGSVGEGIDGDSAGVRAAKVI